LNVRTAVFQILLKTHQAPNPEKLFLKKQKNAQDSKSKRSEGLDRIHMKKLTTQKG